MAFIFFGGTNIYWSGHIIFDGGIATASYASWAELSFLIAKPDWKNHKTIRNNKLGNFFSATCFKFF